jgi:hypothetical protein
MSKPKILLLDIETAPMKLLGWQMYGDLSYGLDQIEEDWSILAWSAKWYNSDKVFYQDTSKQKNKRNDKRILYKIHSLIEEADVLVSQNGVRFDLPKLNARFIYHGLPPIPKKPHIDTKKLAKKSFSFSSNSLEYMCNFLKVKFKKLTDRKFPGFKLWLECLKGNQAAWGEMKRYNIRDVIALQGVYEKLRPWGTGVNLAVFTESLNPACADCGSNNLLKNGFKTTAAGRFQRYNCTGCGAWNYGKKNLLTKEKKSSLRGGQ